MSPISGENTLPKESIKTQKLTNETKFIGQPEPPSPKEIMVNPKLQTDVSIFSTGTVGASATQEKRIPRKKRNIKPLATSPPIKYPIPNQDQIL